MAGVAGHSGRRTRPCPGLTHTDHLCCDGARWPGGAAGGAWWWLCKPTACHGTQPSCCCPWPAACSHAERPGAAPLAGQRPAVAAPAQEPQQRGAHAGAAGRRVQRRHADRTGPGGRQLPCTGCGVGAPCQHLCHAHALADGRAGPCSGHALHAADPLGCPWGPSTASSPGVPWAECPVVPAHQLPGDAHAAGPAAAVQARALLYGGSARDADTHGLGATQPPTNGHAPAGGRAGDAAAAAAAAPAAALLAAATGNGAGNAGMPPPASAAGGVGVMVGMAADISGRLDELVAVSCPAALTLMGFGGPVAGLAGSQAAPSTGSMAARGLPGKRPQAAAPHGPARAWAAAPCSFMRCARPARWCLPVTPAGARLPAGPQAPPPAGGGERVPAEAGGQCAFACRPPARRPALLAGALARVRSSMVPAARSSSSSTTGQQHMAACSCSAHA
jgi:hypothetical protein